MLTLYSQFLLQQGIRAPIYLMNPTVIEQNLVRIPRFTVLHALDLNHDNTFPSRTDYYFNEVPRGKKIPITHVTDLSIKEETTSLKNKYAQMQVRKWNKENLKDFRVKELIEVPNQDVNLVAVFNYNPLKDLYNYKSSLSSAYHKHRNLSTTYWNQIKAAVDASPESHHLVPIEIPNIIPSFMSLNRIMRFDTVKLMRVINEPSLLWILEIYQWLLNDTRSLSPLKDITDKDSSSILLELKCKGYAAYLPLNVIRCIAEESDLESSMKVSGERLQKVFILLLRKIQNFVSELQVQETPVEDVINAEGNDSVEQDLDEHEIEEDRTGVKADQVTIPSDAEEPVEVKSLAEPKTLKGLFKKDLEVQDSDFIDSDIADLSKLIDSESDSDGFIDTLFNDKISKVAEQPVTVKQLNKETSEPEVLSAPIKTLTDEQLDELLKTKPATKINEEFLKKAVDNKTHTSAELRALRKLQETRTILKSPYANETIDSFVASKPKDVKLTDANIKLEIKNDLVDENLFTNKIEAFDKAYMKNLYEKDVVASVANLEKAGFIIKNYEKEQTLTSVDRYETHKLTIKPLEGKESTLYFRLPIIDSEGSFMMGGIRYRIRKTKTDLPIRKISPIRVALTSNYGKFFISRTERKTNDKDDYILSFIRNDYLTDNTVIKKLIPGTKKLNLKDLPNTYHMLSSHFDLIVTDQLTLMLKDDEAGNHLSKEVLSDIRKRNLTFIGYTKAKDILVINHQNTFFNYSKDLAPLGTLEDLLGLDPAKLPKPFSVMKILGTDIPLGVCMGYYLGLSGLLSATKTKWNVIGPRQQYHPTAQELVLKFSDYKLIIETDTVEKQLLFNGFTFYKDTLKLYNLETFDNKDVYLNVIEQRKANLIHLKELTNLHDLFLDPITVDVLESMNEPTDFLPLLLRANQMLENYKHPEINDPYYSRIRGYDRVPGLMYGALAESIREHRVKGKRSVKVSLDPYKVWNYITQDSSVKSRDELNPVLTLKENEALTLGGRGGLSSDAIPVEMRRFHPHETGLVSEATVDSKDVAITTYLSPYAKLDGVRGRVKQDNKEIQENPSKVFSSAVQIAPFSEKDDAKRVNFVSIQYSHTIPSKGYKQSPTRTGYEYIVPHKVGSKFCAVAEEDGTVTDINDKLVTVTYKSGTVKSYPIGTQYGAMEGSYYVHELISDLKKGQKLKKEDIICFHRDFFERDWLDTSKLVMKTTDMATVALTLNNEVFEDSSAVSKELSKSITTEIVKDRVFMLDFKDNIHNLLPVGTKVNPEDVLFMALDETTDSGNLSEQSIAMLQSLASLSPRAKVQGIVDRVEIKYNGDVNDMSSTLKKLALKLDRELYERTKGTEYEAKNNQVSGEYRSAGKGLNVDTLELKVFIRIPLGLAPGDKLVFANNMKTVIGDVFTYDIHTESGDKVDAMFGYQGIINRIVNSPILMGTTNRLTRHFNKQIVDTYFVK